MSFTTVVREPAFAARDLFIDAGSRDGTRALAREILMMEPADYAAAFKGSAMKRAELCMLQRNACVVLGNVGDTDDAPQRITRAKLGYFGAVRVECRETSGPR